jgi:hypothetical protein
LVWGGVAGKGEAKVGTYRGPGGAELRKCYLCHGAVGWDMHMHMHVCVSMCMGGIWLGMVSRLALDEWRAMDGFKRGVSSLR